MSISKCLRSCVAVSFLIAFGGCGLTVPEKNIWNGEYNDSTDRYSKQGDLENLIVGHVKCGIEKGLWRVKTAGSDNTGIPNVGWLYEQNKWGSAVNLTIQVDEQSALSPGVSLAKPLENAVNTFAKGGAVITTQSVSVGLGASAMAHSTRTETIQFTYANTQLLKEATQRFADPKQLACDEGTNGIMIQSDLKIDQFIYDKATIAATGDDANTLRTWAPFSLFEDQITFVATYQGNINPTWKFATVTADQNSTLFNAGRSEINTLIITLGPIDLSKPPSPTSPLQLTGAAQAQHTAASTGLATAGSTKASN